MTCLNIWPLQDFAMMLIKDQNARKETRRIIGLIARIKILRNYFESPILRLVNRQSKESIVVDELYTVVTGVNMSVKIFGYERLKLRVEVIT